MQYRDLINKFSCIVILQGFKNYNECAISLTISIWHMQIVITTSYMNLLDVIVLHGFEESGDT